MKSPKRTGVVLLAVGLPLVAACAPSTDQSDTTVADSTTTTSEDEPEATTTTSEPQPNPATPVDGSMTVQQTISDVAQSTTIAFDGLAFMTGNVCADSFYPPGKVSDFFGFQYLRDNDPTELGHNTAFAATVGQNVLAILTDSQTEQLVELARAQVDDINDYAYARFPLIEAFRRRLESDIPDGSGGLSEAAVSEYSAQQLYQLDSEISYARAELFASVLEELTVDQRAQLDALVGVGVGEWPDAREAEDRWRTELDHDEHVALMTYAGQFFSWYAGDVEADTYFPPERQGTYFGSFYLKDAPALMSQATGQDVSISTNLTRDYGDLFLAALTDQQRTTIEGLVDDQRAALTELVETRRAIATQLRLLSTGTEQEKAAVHETVIDLAERYGELDGEIVYLYATAFADVYQSLTSEQLALLTDYRQSDEHLGLNSTLGDPCTVDPEGSAYLYSEQIDMPTTDNTDFLFG